MDLRGMMEKTLPGLGYELVEVETSARGRLVRVFIDKPGGVDVEDCARVSEHLSRLLAVENVDYDRLEVSSPGLDRPLRTKDDFLRFTGEEAQIRMRSLIGNRRNFVGRISAVTDGNVMLQDDSGLAALPLDSIDRARLVPRIDWSKK